MNKVLITGATGFIAHHFVKEILESTDWKIITLERLSFTGNLNRLNEIVKDKGNGRIKIIHHDLRSEIGPLLKKQIGEVDYIFHIAASSHVDRSIQNPMNFVLDNVVGTCNILNFAREQKQLKRFFYFSTDEVFGPAKSDITFNEYSRYNARNPYSATKAGGEELCVAFNNTYNLPMCITHTMNVFGERQHPEKFIPLCIRKILNDETLIIHTDKDGKPGSRKYIYASEVGKALIFLANSELTSDDGTGITCPKYNITAKYEVDNLEMAKKIAKILDKELKYTLTDSHSVRPGHDNRYSVCGERMEKLGWVDATELDAKLEQVVNHYVQNDTWLKTWD